MKHSLRPGKEPVRVLVIDDDDIARASMVDLLQAAGYEVSDLPSPIGATHKLLQDRIDVVVLDVMMPSLRGDKLATLLRKNPRLQHLGVILVTGALPDELNQMALEVMAQAVIEKSNIDALLVEAVHRAARGAVAPTGHHPPESGATPRVAVPRSEKSPVRAPEVGASIRACTERPGTNAS